MIGKLDVITIVLMCITAWYLFELLQKEKEINIEGEKAKNQWGKL